MHSLRFASNTLIRYSFKRLKWGEFLELRIKGENKIGKEKRNLDGKII